MSWSVSGTGAPAEVRDQLSAQFKGPLADKPAGLDDEGERETVQKVLELLDQVLSTFDPSKTVQVSAYGHMGFADWKTKVGAYQQIAIAIDAV